MRGMLALLGLVCEESDASRRSASNLNFPSEFEMDQTAGLEKTKQKSSW